MRKKMDTILFENLLRLQEETTMSSIEYLPSTVGALKSRVDSLFKKHKDLRWKVDSDQNSNHRVARLGEILSIRVPHQYWNDFSRNFKVVENTNISESKVFEEKDSFSRGDVLSILRSFYYSPLTNVVERGVLLWRRFFGIGGFLDLDTAVRVSSKEKDLKRIAEELLLVYRQDPGALEQLRRAASEEVGLHLFQILNRYDYLYGEFIWSVYKKEELRFFCVVDSARQLIEKIYWRIDSPLIREKIEEELGDRLEIDHHRGVLYPRGMRFQRTDFRFLRNLIREYS